MAIKAFDESPFRVLHGYYARSDRDGGCDWGRSKKFRRRSAKMKITPKILRDLNHLLIYFAREEEEIPPPLIRPVGRSGPRRTERGEMSPFAIERDLSVN